MTPWMLLAALRRHVVVALLGMVLTGIGVAWAGQADGVYYQRAHVILLSPPPAEHINSYQYIGASLIAAAGLVRLESEQVPVEPQPVSPDVTIVDEGVRNAVSVRLVNEGGQWAYVYTRPILDVQVAGPSPAVVQERMDSTIRRIERQLVSDQLAVGVSPKNMISTTLSPPFPPLLLREGRPVRAMTMAGLAGLLLTALAVSTLDRWTVRRLVAGHAAFSGETPQQLATTGDRIP